MADTAFPITLSLRVAALALLLSGPLGVCLALLQARAEYRLRRVVDALILLPLVLPPSVLGFLLVLVFGRRGVVGHFLDAAFGVRLVFTPLAATLAAAIVSLPIVVKTAQPAIEAVPLSLERVAATLGLSSTRVVFRVTLPLAWRGVLAGIVLGFARALGEFGATLMFAGNVPGRTNTMPLEIFTAYQTGDDARAGLYVGILVLFSFAVVLLADALSSRVAL